MAGVRGVGQVATIAMMLLAAPAVGASVQSARPTGSPGEWFSPDDYPAAALRAGESGRVVMTLGIDSAGNVVSCLVSHSSGSPSLDSTSCALALARGRFAPARDRKGRPVASNYTLPIRWALPATPVEVGEGTAVAHEQTFDVSVDPHGIVLACHLVSRSPAGDRDPCDDYAIGKQIALGWTRQGRPAGATIRMHFSNVVTVDP